MSRTLNLGGKELHGLSRVRIVNFRSCVDTAIDLADFTPMVGCNNGGKSNILAAVKWLLRPKSLSAADFNEASGPVSVEGLVTGITSEILAGVQEKHRKKIEPHCADGVLRVRRYQASPGMSVSQVRLEIPDDDDGWEKAPTGIPEGLQALFPEPIEIGAMENAAEDAGKFKTSTTIGKLIGDIIEPIREEHGEAIRKELEGLRCKLDADGSDRPAQVLEFDTAANEALSSFFPDVTLRLHIPTPDLSALFKTGTIKVYEQDGVGREITCLGHGAQRAIQMALVRCLADRSSERVASARRVLLVEEPELYMHPHALEQVRLSLKRLSKAGYQVLVATHSPLVIAPEDVPDTLLIRKSDGRGTEARQTLRDAVKSAVADNPSQARVLFSLSNSSQLLFADKVVLAEGKTEHVLIPALFEQALGEGRTLGLARVALISQGGVDNTHKSMEILRAMNVPCKAIVDLDYAFRGALSAGYLDSADPDLVASRGILSSIAAKEGCPLSGAGLPMNGGPLTSRELFAKLGTDAGAAARLKNLHEKLLKKDIWLWTLGSMDEHVGLKTKSESAWASFLDSLLQSHMSAVHDEDGVRALAKWMES